MKKWRKVVVWTAAATAIAAASAIAAAPRYARYRAAEWAKGRGLALEAREVEVHLGSIRLKNARITSPFFPRQEVKLDSVEVKLDGVRIETVKVDGGAVSLNGRAEELERMYREWEARRTGGGGESAGKSQKAVNGVKLSWIGPDGDGSGVEASGVSWADGVASAKSVEVKLRTKEAKFSDVELSKTEDGYRISSVETNIKLRETKDDGGMTKSLRIGVPRLPELPAIRSRLSVNLRRASVEVGGREIRAEDLDASVSGVANTVTVKASAGHLEIPGKTRFLKFGTELSVTRNGVRGKAWFGSIGTSYKALTDSEIETGGAEISGEARLTADGVEALADMRLKKARVHTEVEASGKEIRIRADMDESNCQDVLESVPKALVKTIMPGTRMGGKLSWKIQVDVDLPDRKKPSVRLKLKNDCSVEGLPDGISVKTLRKPFVRRALGYDKKEREVRTGPGSPEWVPIQLVSRFVPVSLKTMEDPGFNGHHGFLIEALENALKADIQEGRFARGGSTITMQLAKNLWLGREKTLSRKLQEAVLTIYLEQELPKDKILELYMNVVEFGPGVYGIKAAAKKYFNADPMELTLSQSLLLASVLPKPNGAYFGPDGAVHPGRLALLHRIMKAMLDTQRISEDEYREGLREVPREGVPETAVGPADKIEATPDGLDPGSWQAD